MFNMWRENADERQQRSGYRGRRQPACDVHRGPDRRRCAGWASLAAVAAVIAVTGTTARSQPVFGVQDFDNAMKATGRNVRLVHDAITAGDFDTAKMRVARAREQLSPTVAFWRNTNEPEAVKLLREAIKTLDELDVSLSRGPIDVGAVVAAGTKVDAACQRCHAVYRDQDATSKAFVIKQRR
jgi:cytochrome c556